MKYTPTPWNEDAIYELLRHGRKSFGPWDDCIEVDEYLPDENDAKLIAAAPDLLEALEEATEQLELSLQRLGCCGHGDGKGRKADVDDFGGYGSLATARQALEKARGE